MQKNLLRDILRTNKTVFTFKELSMMWPGLDVDDLKSRINYYLKRGDLYHIRRGLYAKDGSYSKLEVATKIFTPSYVSFETVLGSAGIIFQFYKDIFVATYQSRTVVCDGQAYIFKTIKSEVLTNGLGIEVNDNYSIATKERAFLDTLYINKDYYFDNLIPLDWDKVYEILPIYKNKRMVKSVDKFYRSFKSDNG